MKIVEVDVTIVENGDVTLAVGGVSVIAMPKKGEYIGVSSTIVEETPWIS